MESNLKKLLVAFCCFFIIQFLLVGCKSRNIKNSAYFQNAFDTTVLKKKYQEYKFKIDDILAIQVISGTLKQDDAGVFNTPTVGGVRAGAASTYQVDSFGFITFPRIGKLKAESLNKYELSNNIEKLLIDEVKNPLVIVNLDKFKVNVLGEVRKPGIVTLRSDKANIIDVLSEVGDINDYGSRDSIMILRKLDEKYEAYKVDLTNVAFINGPAFQVFPDDIVYVGPNKRKNKYSEDRTNYLRDLSIVISSISTIVYLFTIVGIIKR